MKMRYGTRVLALIMGVLMALTSPVQAFAEGESANQSGDYLSEVYVAVAKTTDEAAKALREKGYDVLKGDDGKPADLNQGAGSALKQNRAVLLGYRTTGDRGKALTDLAVMGMNGGYSFSDYRTLMAKYRDSQIRPLIERFMAAVREYRESAASENPGNRARAEAARELLNHVVEDDSGGRLGDMLLGQTLQELGIDTASMTDERARAERAAHPANLDLECALMQGNADVVLLVERLVSMAADPQPTTWLERLSALGPDGLASTNVDQRPTDAAQEMTAAYQDTAKAVAKEWESLRSLLLDHEATVAKDEAGQAPSDGTGTSDIAADGGDVEDPGYEVPELEAADAGEVGVKDADEPELSVDNAEQIVESIAGNMQATSELADQAVESLAASLYWYLKSLPYGEGTLYDLFARPVEDVSANGYEALYPLASVLTPGQVAGLEFLSLTTMAVNGVASGEAFEAMGPGCAGIVDGLGSNDVSIYANVNRELFSDKVALTSEALRRGEVGSAWDDLLSLRNFMILSWVGTAISGVAALATARRAAALAQELVPINNRIAALRQTSRNLRQTSASLYDLLWLHEYIHYDAMHIMKVETVSGLEAAEELPNLVGAAHKVTITHRVKTGEVFVQTRYFDAATSGLNENMAGMYGEVDARYQLDELARKNELKADKMMRESNGIRSRASRTNVAKYVTSGLFVLLAVASITLTAIDVYNYYHVKMTPVPKYIVDAVDITSKAEDGTTTVLRNDSAYYQAVRTDSRREGDTLTAMEDYADLNGDAGKGWLALYSNASSAKAPILASSMKVVTGTSSVPTGYESSIHEFGSASAANLTDMRYSYNDDANGVYAYFKREVGAPVTASAIARINVSAVGGLCLVAGTALGAGGMYLFGKRRRDPHSEA